MTPPRLLAVVAPPQILAGFRGRFRFKIRKIAFQARRTGSFAPLYIVRDVNRHAWRATEQIA
jgi:hypothetical protein